MRMRALAIVLASLYVGMASAGGVVKGHISVDFGPVFGPGSDGDDFGTNTVGDGTACTAGSSGPESCPLTLINDGSTGAIPLGFPIDFGTGTVSSLYINENGIVSFTGPITSNSFGSLAGLGQPVIGPFYADLTSTTFVGTVFEMSGTHFGQIMYQRGSASALPGSDGNFDQADEVPAFSVLWYGPTDADGVQIFTQIVIYSHASSGSGDFDVRLRYGQVDGDLYNTGTGTTGIAGLLLGTNTLNITGPLDGSVDHFYSFRGGLLVGTAPPPPPVTLACPSATAQAGVAYSSTLTASGGVTPYTFSYSGSLPPGVQLNAASGAIAGTPTSAGPFAFTAQVTDASGTAAGSVTASCTITVAPAVVPPALKVSPGSVSFGTLGRFSLQSRTVLLTNTGTGTILLSRESVTPAAGSPRGDFAALSFCGTSLGAGKSCPIYVILFAKDLGSIAATLNIPNSGTNSPQAVPLSVIVTPLKH
jgi:hypothetical protein